MALVCLPVAHAESGGSVEEVKLVEQVEPVGNSDEKSDVIDLSAVSFDKNLVFDMQGFHVSGEGHASLNKALREGRWQLVSENPGILEKPRQYSTLWLKVRLENSSDEHVVRWLDLTPWRLNQVNAWLVEPVSLDIRNEMTTGLKIPIDKRVVDSNKAIIPVSISPGESLLLVARIFSDSRPFLEIRSWEPVAFSMSEMAEWQFHSMLLAAVMTLLAVLLVTLDFRYALLGAWLLVIFIFESEKEGYISQVLVSSLFDYSANLRFSTWILTEAVFLVTSVYILGINKQRPWRFTLPVLLMVSAVFSGLTFFLGGDVIRNIGNAIDLSFSLVWLMMIPAALRVDRQWQYALLGTLSLWWLASNFVLIGYITNLYYTASFVEMKIFSGITIVLSLLLIYSRQKRGHELNLEKKLRESERNQREKLEALVVRRTHDLNQALDDARKTNEEKTLFLGRISHDLKSPLTSISGYAQLLSAEDAESANFARIIHSSATHMSRLIERLVGYARGVVSHKERLSTIHVESFFTAVFQEAEALTSRNGNGFSINVETGDFPFVRCDDVSLRQVVINLIDNAAKYTSSGNVSLEVNCHEMVGKTEQLALDMTFRDTGCGISRERIKRIFEPFSRESRDSEGTGLGLAIVKDLVTTMEGSVSLNSEPGSGTEVHVLIPVGVGDESEVLNEPASMPGALLPAYRVDGLSAWVVEDSQPILDLLCSDLSTMGFAIKGFQKGREAIAAIQNAEPVPDLIVTDYRLQGVSGDEVLMAAKARHDWIPVMLISATWSVLKSRDQQSSDLEYAACLSKPINLVDFRREVARVCALSPTRQPDPLGKEASTGSGDEPDIQQLLYLLEMGAVSDIMDWCDAYAAVCPDNKSLAAQLRSQAERGDFSGIKRSISVLQ
ncbi:hybrid sensor histidine kinase/response regulator [Halomonas marinisediminis]|nr:ATP-binding protein [Halomonas marinisediminis]